MLCRLTVVCLFVVQRLPRPAPPGHPHVSIRDGFSFLKQIHCEVSDTLVKGMVSLGTLNHVTLLVHLDTVVHATLSLYTTHLLVAG